jgi:hypothetical protein
MTHKPLKTNNTRKARDVLKEYAAREQITANMRKYYPIQNPGIKPIPKDTQTIKQLADELLAWAYSTEDINIETFPLTKGYNSYKFFKLAKVDEYFADALGNAQEVIANRIVHEWYNGQAEKSCAKELAGLYRASFKDKAIEEAKIQAEFKIIAPTFPSSPLVPERVDIFTTNTSESESHDRSNEATQENVECIEDSSTGPFYD